MKNLLLLSSLLLSTALFAAPTLSPEEKLGSFSVEEVSAEQLVNMGLGKETSSLKSGPGLGYGGPGGFAGGGPGGFAGGDIGGSGGGTDPGTDTGSGYYTGGGSGSTIDDQIARGGQIISVARDVVALGEAIYDLVRRGKPTNITDYAPISVVPRDPSTKEHVDPFDLEGFSFPVERNFVAKVKNGVGKVVVLFNYKVMYSYGGSYNGAGRYLTNVIIVPGSVRTAFGWEFNATMMLTGIMNHGSKANPVAGVMVTVKYQMNGWKTAYERNDTIHITGNGQFKTYAR